eukprot:GFUD01042502.1.p1 GENE.GFUD01042502.1~~GFUD01042502.1.p1  ORF type:complete len:450 (+),score=180.21 GFUD01042502.1:281-1630(+)
MSENFEPFPFDVILKFLQEQGWENCSGLTLQDLRQPTAPLAQKLYFNFLQEFGFSDSLLMIPFEVLEDLESPDIYKDMIPIMSLQAACVHLFTKLTGDSGFGIMDLINPTAKRTQRFISVMQNFWLFCNNQWAHVEQIQGEVDRLVRSRVEYEAKIEEYKNKINQCKSKAVEEKAEEDSLMEEIDQLKEELKQMFPKQKELNEMRSNLKTELESLATKKTGLLEELRKVEAERDNLQGVFEGAAVLQKLDVELIEIREELGLKEKRKLEFRNHLELLDRCKEDYSAVLELVQQIAQEQQKTRDLVGKIREHHTVMESTKLEKEEAESVIRELENQFKERSAVLAKMRGQWARRKKGKEEEIQQGGSELEEAKLQLGEEQLAAMDLSNKIRDLNLMCEDEQEEMARLAGNTRAHYSMVLEAMEKFNNKLNEDFAKIGEAKNKLNQGPPAL